MLLGKKLQRRRNSGGEERAQLLPPSPYLTGARPARGASIRSTDRRSVSERQCECGAAEQQAGALVLVHPLVPHGLVPCAEARPGAGAQDAAGHDDVLQQVLGQERAVTGLRHVPPAAATPHRRPDGENERASSSSALPHSSQSTFCSFWSHCVDCLTVDNEKDRFFHEFISAIQFTV